jgi:hypothetical protein
MFGLQIALKGWKVQCSAALQRGMCWLQKGLQTQPPETDPPNNGGVEKLLSASGSARLCLE